MRIRTYCSSAFFWALAILILMEVGVRSSPELQFWITKYNSIGVLAPYLYNSGELKRIGAHVRVLIIGDSMAMMSVDARQLARELGLPPLGIYNFSHGGAGPASHLKNFHLLRPFLPNLESVILFIQPRRLSQVEGASQTIAEDLLGSSANPFVEAWNQHSLRPLLQRYSLLLQLAPFWNKRPPRLPFPGLRPRPGGGIQMDDIKPSKARLISPEPFQSNREAIDKLEELLLDLKKEGLVVQELMPPYHPDFQKEWNGKDEDQAVCELFSRYERQGLVQFYPEAFRGLAETLRPFFLDYSHLVPAGTASFTHSLAQHLRQHPVPPLR